MSKKEGFEVKEVSVEETRKEKISSKEDSGNEDEVNDLKSEGKTKKV